MDNVFIFGPPGAGKLTLARELANLTGFKLLDNHTTIRWAGSLFAFPTAPFWRLESHLREVAFEAAAAEDVSLISTFLWPTPAAMQYIERYSTMAEAAGGRTIPVQLVCERSVLEARVASPGRSELGKLTSVAVLGRMIAQTDFYSSPEIGREVLRIDNTSVSPDVVARQIIEHYGLPVV